VIINVAKVENTQGYVKREISRDAWIADLGVGMTA
jgi:hypothetical protein